MTITIVASASAPHQMQNAQALRDGLRRHGVAATLVHSHESVRTDTVACWGWRRGAWHRELGRDVLVLERGYLGDRFAWTSVGWNGLNGRARFAHCDDAGERFQQNHGHLLQPWRSGGDYVLIVGQVPGDAALGGRCLRSWYAEQAERASTMYGLPVRFRPHPLAARRGGPSSVPGAETMTGELRDALRGAALVATFNSNAGVDAILAGRPAVAMDEGSMVHGVALADMPASLDAPEPARLAHLHRMAWAQFTLEEIASGDAWAMVGSMRRG